MFAALRFTPIIISALLALSASGACSAAQAAPMKDVDDPFYKYDKPLENVAPGTVLRTREVTLAPAGVPLAPFATTQVLYRTTKTSGSAVATVATIMRPLASPTTRILSYQTAYDDLGSTCTPSYVLQGGGGVPGVSPALETGVMIGYLAQGFTVVTSDYEGITHDYPAGQGAGWATLDAIRAARTVLRVRVGTPVGLIGYSGGAIATQWASELAPGYSPETNIVGAASGGIPVHFPNTINYVEGSTAWAGVIPYLLVGLFRGLEIDISRYLSPRGKQIAKDASTTCLDTGPYAGLHISDMLVDEHKDYRKIRPFVRALNSQIMGNSGVPQSPVLFGNGNSDGIGDGVMISRDVEALAHKYCAAGVPVRYTRYPALDHVGGIPVFEVEAIAWLQARFAGVPMIDNCSSNGVSGKLEPLPLPPLPKLSVGAVTRSSGGYSLRARIPASVANKVTVSVYAFSGSKRKRIATARPTGDLTAKARTLKLPLRRGVAGRTYTVVVAGLADGEKVSATKKFRAPR